jgi:hypothetical protein
VNPLDPRYRRQLSGFAKPSFPLTLNQRTGELAYQFSPRGPLFANPNLGADLRVDFPLTVATHSPYAVTLAFGRGFSVMDDGLEPKLAGTMKFDDMGRVAANVTAADVSQDEGETGIEGATVEAALARVQINKANTLDVDAANAVQDGRLDVLEADAVFARGEATLVGGSVAVTITGIDSASIVMVGHKTFIGTPGMLSWAITANKLTITSLDALDVSVVHYVVWPP